MHKSVQEKKNPAEKEVFQSGTRFNA